MERGVGMGDGGWGMLKSYFEKKSSNLNGFIVGMG